MKQLLTLIATLAVLVPASLAAKGPTTRIVITDVVDGRKVSLVEPSVLARFNVWDGPGTFSGTSDREVESTTGFIADWTRGAIASRRRGLPKFEVQFFVRDHGTGPERLAYVVLYERDPETGEGFVYLPGKTDGQFEANVRSIYRGSGYEGHWFRASPAWQQATRTLLDW